MSFFRRLTDERGVALPVAMAVLFVVAGLATVAARAAIVSNNQSFRDNNAKRAVQAANAGLQAAVFANMAVTVLGRSALVPGMREVGVTDYFPPLPKVDLLLYRAAGRHSPALDALHNYLSHSLKAASLVPGQVVASEAPLEAPASAP